MGLEQLESKRQELIRKIATLQSTLEDLDDPTAVQSSIRQLQNKLAQVEAEIQAAGGQPARHYGAGAVHIENSEIQGTINTGTINTGGGDFVGRDKKEDTYHAPVYGGQGNTFNFNTPPPATLSTNPQTPASSVPPNLREKITQYLGETELRGVCFDMGIDYDHLGGRDFPTKVIILIDHCKRHNMLEQLVANCQKANPHRQWS